MSESNEWRVGVLEDIANVNPSVSVAGLANDTEVSFLSMPDVGENGRITNHQCRPFHEVKSGFTRFEENDVLFAKITPCMQNGKGAFATGLHSGIGFGSTEFHVLRANEEGDAEFIYHVSLSPELRTKAIAFFSGSAGQQRVSKDFFGRYTLDIPPPPEQRKIARILTTVDNLIEQTEALIAKYQSIKQGMMHDLFTRGVASSGQLRPTQQQAPDLYKKSELGLIPKEWDVMQLKELYGSPIRDFGSFSMTNLITFLETGVPFMKSEMIEVGSIKWDNVFYISERVHGLLNKSHVRNGDILFSKIGSALGKAVIYDGSRGVCNSNAAIAKIRVDNQKATTPFVASYLNHDIAQTQFKNMIVSLLPRINLGDISSLLTPVPSVQEQRTIDGKLEALDSTIATEKRLLAKHKKSKSGLMQDLLTGKVRVKVDEAEEASAHA